MTHDLSDRDRDLIERLHAAVEAAVRDAEDPGAVLGGTLPLYFDAVFQQGTDQHGPFFDCLDTMLTVYATKYRRLDVLQGVGDICRRITALCDFHVQAGSN